MMRQLAFRLDPLPPFRLDLTVWALRRRPENIVDRWDGQTYERVLIFGQNPVNVAVRQAGTDHNLELQVTVDGATGKSRDLEEFVRRTLDWSLGLSVDLAPFYRLAATDARLGALVDRFRGLKPPRFPSLLEALVNGIACQQITLTQGIRLLNRLTETYGAAFTRGEATTRAFPDSAACLARLQPEALRQLGLSGQKAGAVVEAAACISAGDLNGERLAALEDAAAAARLRRLRGVGRWTAEYVLLRGLGRLHVFPGDDVGAQNSLRRWLGLPEPLDYAGVQAALAPWQAYGGLLYFHLLLDRLTEGGYLGTSN